MATLAALRTAHPLHSSVNSQPKPAVIFHGSLSIAHELQRVLERGGVKAWTVPLPGGG